MLELKIHDKHLEKYQQQYPLLFKDAFLGNHVFDDPSLTEGTLIRLTDTKGKYVATGYYGIQNKGVGWVLSKNKNEKIDKAFFSKKLYQALEKRMGLYNNPKTNAFRVFNGEGDGIGGLTIDFFDGFYLISWYSLGIYAFKDLIVEALGNVAEYDGIYEKKRFDDHTEDGHLKGKKASFPIIVKENGVQLAVNFDDGGMVGFFMDQREVRKSLRDHYAKGKNILNAFSYTGAFSVFAALGGAQKTVSVDLAKRSFEKTVQNFELNGIDPNAHDIIVEDMFHYFKYAMKKNLMYDLVVLDPPSFATSKDYTFSAEKDYPDLLANAIDITFDKGIIIASNNTSTISMDKFRQIIGKGFNVARCNFEILEEHQLPKDFRTNRHFEPSNYLKVIFVRVIKKKG